MEKYYYLTPEKKQTGPFTLKDLLKENISLRTYVWRSGLTKWTRAEAVPEVATLLTASTQVPPVPENMETPPACCPPTLLTNVPEDKTAENAPASTPQPEVFEKEEAEMEDNEDNEDNKIQDNEEKAESRTEEVITPTEQKDGEQLSEQTASAAGSAPEDLEEKPDGAPAQAQEGTGATPPDYIEYQEKSTTPEPPAIPAGPAAGCEPPEIPADYQGDSTGPGNDVLPPCPPTNLVWAILTTVLCCLPLGLVAVYKSTRVERHYKAGDYERALKAYESSVNWCIASITVTALISMGYFSIFYSSFIIGILAALA